MNTEQLKTRLTKEEILEILDHEVVDFEGVRYVREDVSVKIMSDFASQESKIAVDEFKERLKKHVKTLHSKNKKQYDRDDWENLEMTPATYKGSMFACDEILDLIDKL